MEIFEPLDGRKLMAIIYFGVPQNNPSGKQIRKRRFRCEDLLAFCPPQNWLPVVRE
jgi:hypothetical protein